MKILFLVIQLWLSIAFAETDGFILSDDDDISKVESKSYNLKEEETSDDTIIPREQKKSQKHQKNSKVEEESWSKIEFSYLPVLVKYELAESDGSDIDLNTLGHQVTLNQVYSMNSWIALGLNLKALNYTFSDLPSNVSPSSADGEYRSAEFAMKFRPGNKTIEYDLFYLWENDIIEDSSPEQKVDFVATSIGLGVSYTWRVAKKWSIKPAYSFIPTLSYKEDGKSSGDFKQRIQHRILLGSFFQLNQIWSLGFSYEMNYTQLSFEGESEDRNITDATIVEQRHGLIGVSFVYNF